VVGEPKEVPSFLIGTGIALIGYGIGTELASIGIINV